MNSVVPQYIYKIDKAIGEEFEQMCIKLISLSKALPYKVIRMVFFGNPKSQAEYIQHLDIISKNITRQFKDCPPVFSYVSQAPLSGDLVLETTRLVINNDIKINYKKCDKINYITLSSGKEKAVFVGGLISKDITKLSIREQCNEVFAKFDKILKKEKLKRSDVVRQWNYIERITEYDNDDYQHYQCFNDARTHFYDGENWDKGYPAATGIGTSFGGIVIDFDAVLSSRVEVITLDNELQVPAHVYSQDVLLGEEDTILKEKSTPKFERGKTLACDKAAMSYISGTAAIRGEESLESMDILRQTIVTMENIDFLVSVNNLRKYGVKSPLSKPHYRTLRVYLKNGSDLYKVQQYLNDKYPEASKCYLLADVCRDELLIEIEGIVCY